MKRALTIHLPLTAALAMGVASPVMAELEYTNGTGGSARVYGQLTPAWLNVDDGKDTDGNLVDNSRSNSRAGIWLDQEFDNGQMLLFNFEAALGAPQSSKFSQNFQPDWDWQRTDLRKLEFIYSGNFGTVFFGQGSMASDNTSTLDLSATTLASTVTVPDAAGGYFFRQKDGTLSSVAVSNVFKDYDGGRKARIRYDTPRFGGTEPGKGISIGASYGQDLLNSSDDAEYYDIGLNYSDTISSITVRAGLSYAWKDDDGTTERYGGSISALSDVNGLNGTLSFGGDPDGGQFGYIKLGWITSFWTIGDTAFSADYYSGNDIAGSDGTSTSTGLQVAQYFDDTNLSIYFGYNRLTYDDKAASYDDMDVILAGLQWKF
ncbi:MULTISPECIES: porin [unclassified Meridianimarinicoccus]|uniref:porin n=1 Tax=unclassified Meridianimarinicoccus TaxID=2923344 RepID=UPI001868F0AA|nr:porin [Fluviibacterium sp. MJW13]